MSNPFLATSRCLPKTILLFAQIHSALHRRHLDILRCMQVMGSRGVHRVEVFGWDVGYSTLYLTNNFDTSWKTSITHAWHKSTWGHAMLPISPKSSKKPRSGLSEQTKQHIGATYFHFQLILSKVTLSEINLLLKTHYLNNSNTFMSSKILVWIHNMDTLGCNTYIVVWSSTSSMSIFLLLSLS